MAVRRHRCAKALTVVVTCALLFVAGASAHEGDGLKLPRPTGSHHVGMRPTFLVDPARTDPTTGAPRAIPVRVWDPAKDDDGPPAPSRSWRSTIRTRPSSPSSPEDR
jgi:hypothetical protein